MMTLLEKQAFIRQKAVENRQTSDGTKILWWRHAISEAVKDNLSRQDVECALEFAEIIEDYPPLKRPLPDCLVLGFLRTNRPLHIVIALDRLSDRLFIITVYLPSGEKWENDWRTRK